MNPNALRYFIAVAEQKSLRAAGDLLHISQSALSRQIMNLENELGAPLLERLPRGIRLTSAGELFLTYARQGVGEFDRLRSEVSALQGLYRGTIRIAAPEAFMQMALPDCICDFRRRYPGVNIIVKLGTTSAVVNDVRDGHVDFGIAFNPALDAEVTRFHEIPERIVAAMAPTHPLASRKRMSLGDLDGAPLALPLPSSATGELIFRAAREAGVKLRAAVETSSVQMRVRMALESDLVAILAHISVADLVREGRLHQVPLRDRLLGQGKIVLFGLSGRRLSVAADKFLKLFHSELQSPRFRAQIAGRGR
ncbi:LysR family transcriptional regulator [Terrarubrum flagellatum]|uniref:LysR family transcriptional regulator n=1 Tax=Terrirubrum flagellatum TaxID=2895980 RepID=UPI0031453EFB